MKANRKFLKANDEGVSPVIAVILMVAITVVLAATVYVWVSGFSTGGQAPAKTLSLSSNGAIGGLGTMKNYTVTAASPGMKWSDVKFTLDGADLTYTGPTSGDNQYCVATSGSTCVATATWDGSASVNAGQQLNIRDTGVAGQTLRALDTQANSVILTMVVG